MIAARLTSRGRVTIPKKIREHLRLKPGDRVVFVLREREVVIRSAELTLRDLRGTVEPHQEPEDFDAVRAKARKVVARRRAGRPKSDLRDG
jgi:AbrB family looped-hinge helix DNA binding protein